MAVYFLSHYRLSRDKDRGYSYFSFFISLDTLYNTVPLVYAIVTVLFISIASCYLTNSNRLMLAQVHYKISTDMDLDFNGVLLNAEIKSTFIYD